MPRFDSQERGIAHKLDVLVDYGTDPLGAIGNSVCTLADSLDAAAVVLAGHRHSAWVELMLGSVTNHVIHHCNKPVVVLPGGGAKGE